MPDREKVIRALTFCCYDIHDGDCNLDCPYYDACSVGSPVPAVLYDALALLKEQEPRVLTEEELKRIEPYSVYWGEGLYVRNLWPMAFTAEAIQNINEGYLKDSYGRAYELDLYNNDVMGWRIWTARPTEEQRKEVKWVE